MAGKTDDLVTLTDLEHLLDARRLAEAVETVAAHRASARNTRTFSVTVTTARCEIGNSHTVEDRVSQQIQQKLDLQPSPPRTRAPSDIRVFIDEAFALAGVRLFDQPLSSRTYRKAAYHGALRPTVAAAMVTLAAILHPPRLLWDPCCGSGTILAEAHRQGFHVNGSDINPEAVDVARTTLRSLDPQLWSVITHADLTKQGTWKKHLQADAVVTNIAWGKQVRISSHQGLFRNLGIGLGELASRGGVACVLTGHPDLLIRQIEKHSASTHPAIQTRKIGLLGQTPTIVTVTG